MKITFTKEDKERIDKYVEEEAQKKDVPFMTITRFLNEKGFTGLSEEGLKYFLNKVGDFIEIPGEDIKREGDKVEISNISYHGFFLLQLKKYGNDAGAQNNISPEEVEEDYRYLKENLALLEAYDYGILNGQSRWGFKAGSLREKGEDVEAELKRILNKDYILNIIYKLPKLEVKEITDKNVVLLKNEDFISEPSSNKGNLSPKLKAKFDKYIADFKEGEILDLDYLDYNNLNKAGRDYLKNKFPYVTISDNYLHFERATEVLKIDTEQKQTHETLISTLQDFQDTFAKSKGVINVFGFVKLSKALINEINKALEYFVVNLRGLEVTRDYDSKNKVNLNIKVVIPKDKTNRVYNSVVKFLKNPVIKIFLPMLAREGKTVLEKETYRRSWHLTQSRLKQFEKPLTNYSMFEDKETQNFIEKNFNEPLRNLINLTNSEEKLVDVIEKLVHVKSLNKYDQDSGDFYKANGIAKTDKNGEEVQLVVTYNEIAKEYYGRDKTGNTEKEHIFNTIVSIANKKQPIIYEYRDYKKKKGDYDLVKIETLAPLFHISNITKIEVRDNVPKAASKEVGLYLNNIFINQIKNKYINMPIDILERSYKAFGNNNLSKPFRRLRDYCLTSITSKTYSFKYTYDKLVSYLAQSEIDNGQKGRAKKYTEKAIDSCIKLGLINEVDRTGRTISGEVMYIFKLNKDFK